MTSLLKIDNLTISVPGRDPLLRGISFAIERGESVAIVGESGSGKSLTARAILGLFPESANLGGSVHVGDIDTVSATEPSLRKIRRNNVSMIFQDPRAGINPVRKIGDFLTETLVRWREMSKEDAASKALQQLEQVGLPRAKTLLDQYPHQLSGGMLQRVMIAAALLDEPELMLCDEPTTALDVTTQAGIVSLLREQQQARGMGMLFITHDLGLAASLCERVVVLRQGEVVETGQTQEVFVAPSQAYTRELLEAIPRIETRNRLPERSTAIPGAVQAPAVLAEGISKQYKVPGRKDIQALNDVSFSLRQGGSLGIVGESGSGKSTFARILVGLEQATTGMLSIGGVDRPNRPLTAGERRKFARHTQMVFQDPYLSLDPRIPVGRAVSDVVQLHRQVSKRESEQITRELFDRVGFSSQQIEARPKALSGGQRQRVALAKALAAQPSTLVLDEATSALDVSVQARVLELIEEVREEYGLTIIFVSHDLAVVSRICEETLVMQHGRLVEHGPTEQILGNPREEYTRRLLDSYPEPLWLEPAPEPA
jgi:peptide/nickel transport system ATP-binding protein